MNDGPAHLRRGAAAERAAAQWLSQKGLSIVERNFSCRRGEIDLIGWDGEHLIFVEVRYRSRKDYGSPEETVDRRKQGRIIAAAQWYLLQHPEYEEQPCRFDVLVNDHTDTHGDFRWIQDAFQCD